MRFRIQNSRFKIQESSKFTARRSEGSKIRKLSLFALNLLLSVFSLSVLLLTLSSPLSSADVYAPSDSVVLTVGCLDTTFLNLADPDSVWFRWWKDVGGQTIVDSAKVISSLRTGLIRHKIKASDDSDNSGTYLAEAVVYKDGKSGIKTWSWTVKAEFDSLTNAIADANKLNFMAEVVKVDGGYLGQCTTVVNEVNVISTDTVKAEVLDKTGFSLTEDYMTKADSSLYMRTDWENIKNQDAAVNLDQTHMAYVETVDSVNEEMAAGADTSQIKSMNQNNLWGASYVWNFETRTLTSGAGSGANGVIIRCKQSSDSSNIASAQIQVLDSVENSTIGLLTTDSQGRGFFALDNGTYCVRMFKPGWQFTVPETFIVSGDEDTTYYADAFDPGSPPQAALCRVYGWIYDINNQPVEGAKVEASIKTVPLRYQNLIISPYYKSTSTDEEGYWYLDLHPNSALTPSDTKYTFFIYSPSGTILRIETTVPDQGSWELKW